MPEYGVDGGLFADRLRQSGRGDREADECNHCASHRFSISYQIRAKLLVTPGIGSPNGSTRTVAKLRLTPGGGADRLLCRNQSRLERQAATAHVHGALH